MYEVGVVISVEVACLSYYCSVMNYYISTCCPLVAVSIRGCKSHAI